MSSRPLVKPHSVITSGDMSAASITSDVTIVQQLSNICYSYSWTGSTPVGTLKVQASNDYSIDPGGVVLNAGTWNTLDLEVNGSVVSSIDVTGNTGNGMINIANLAAYAIRTVYTKTSGTGTLQAIIVAKVV